MASKKEQEKMVEKFQGIVTIYRGKFTEMRIEKEEFPHNKCLHSSNRGLSHCYYLLDSIEGFLKKGDIEKGKHWIGFIQGILFMEGLYTIDQLKSHGE